MKNIFLYLFLLMIFIPAFFTCDGLFINPFTNNVATTLTTSTPTTSTPTTSTPATAVPTPSVTPLPGSIELALNKPAYAGTYMRFNPPGSATDGDDTTGWCAVNSGLTWWSVNLKASYTLTSIQFMLEAANIDVKYSIEISPDNTNWTTILDKTGNTNENQIQSEIISGEGQYVKMTFTGIISTKWPMIYEFKIYGYGATPSPTSTPTPGTPAPNVNLVKNPGFEDDDGSMQNPFGWLTTGSLNADFTETGTTNPVYPVHSGSYKLKHIGKNKTDAYNVYTYQIITGLTPGLYTLKAWGYSDTGMTTHLMKASNYGGADLTVNISDIDANYHQISITDINVTADHCEIGFESAGTNTHTNIDDVEFFLQP